MSADSPLVSIRLAREFRAPNDAAGMFDVPSRSISTDNIELSDYEAWLILACDDCVVIHRSHAHPDSSSSSCPGLGRSNNIAPQDQMMIDTPNDSIQDLVELMQSSLSLGFAGQRLPRVESENPLFGHGTDQVTDGQFDVDDTFYTNTTDTTMSERSQEWVDTDFTDTTFPDSSEDSDDIEMGEDNADDLMGLELDNLSLEDEDSDE
jgi:hypothetical protein